MAEFQWNEELHIAMQVIKSQAETIARVTALADEWDAEHTRCRAAFKKGAGEYMDGRGDGIGAAADHLRAVLAIAAAPKLAGEEP